MTVSARRSVRRAYEAIERSGRPEVWTTLRTRDEAEAAADLVDEAGEAGANLPLRGLTLAVKDNIDVAGLPTTLGLPAAARVPSADATAVARLTAAGAVVVGKTNMDQFATGLVGTRSPYGAVRGSRLPTLVSGGSSSGSAVAVALGLVDIALGTDTAGSGRVPAALNAIIGVKPTLGTIPTTGMAPACWPYDTITAFARDIETAVAATALMRGPDGIDPGVREAPAGLRLAAPPRPAVAIPAAAGLESLTPDAHRAWDASVERLSRLAEVTVVDIQPLLDAARLLYGGAIVAGRYTAAGGYVEGGAGLDPTVTGIIRSARDVAGWEYVRDRQELDRVKAAALQLLRGADALMLPTAPGHPSLEDVAAEPVAANSWLGTFTNFVNLLDLSAVAVPAGQLGPDGASGDFGVSFVGRPFEDQVVVDIASAFVGARPSPEIGDPGLELAVFGAHLRGQPLNGQLVDAGARFLGEIRTAPEYRLFALATDPPKPGLVPARDGASISGELWRISTAALGTLLGALPAPMTLGPTRLSDGRSVVGFGCTADALTGAHDITATGGWRDYLASLV
ncbi:allophanate hydrolase [Leifsonia sp. AG29]|uniref:allophanate hydrolase n=1 Tax=Leifsonia sp. AG29 TaxID=2598860 RepID=UPI00131DC9AB|nr:allophanate hydrolase [Leifsonia sp. AG29]